MVQQIIEYVILLANVQNHQKRIEMKVSKLRGSTICGFVSFQTILFDLKSLMQLRP